jgi:hypothetical protein
MLASSDLVVEVACFKLQLYQMASMVFAYFLAACKK